MCDRRGRSEPGRRSGLLIALLCVLWAATAGASTQSFFGSPEPTATVKTAEKSIGGTLQVAAGFGGTVHYNQGAGWVSLAYPSGEDLNAIGATSLENLWVGGTGGVRRFDGEAWSALENLGSAINGLLVFSDGVVACGEGGRVMRNTGSGWVNLASGTSLALRGIWGVATNDFWVCGASGRIQRYKNGQWTTITSGTTQTLHSIWGAPGVGPFFAGNAGTLLEFRDGAIAQIITGNSNNIYALDGTAATNVWACGQGGWVWRWDGQNLTTPTPGGADEYRAIRALPSGLVTIAGANGLVRHYNGSSWTTNNISGVGLRTGLLSLPAPDNAGWWDGFAAPPQGQGLMSGSGPGAALNLAAGGDRLYALGFFDHAGDVPAESFAEFDGEVWRALPPVYPGFEGHHLDFFQGDPVAFGYDQEEVLGVYRWTGTQLERLGDLPPTATTVIHLRSVVVGGEERLYIAGNLRDPDDTDIGAVFRWHPETLDWRLVGQGLPVRMYYAMEAHGGDLFVGGASTYEAPFDGAVMRLAGAAPGGTWQQVLTTTEFFPVSLLSHQGQLYAGCGLAPNFDALRRYVPGGPADWQGQGAVLPEGRHFVFDMDSWGDRIVLVGDFPSLGTTAARNVAYWVAGEIHALGTGIPGEATIAVAGLGDDVYVGGFNLRAAGGRESFGIARWRDPESTGPLVPTVTFDLPAAVTQGQPLTVTADVQSFQSVRAVRLAYRALDEQSFTHVPMLPAPGKSDGTFTATIPGAQITQYGLQHFVTVQTDQVTVTVPPNAGVAAGFTGTAVTFIATQEVAERYELFGIPFAPFGNMRQIFENNLGAYDPSRWRLERWNPGTQRYLPFPQVPAVAPGRGYYIIQRNPRNLTISGATTSTVNGAAILLEPGWNMIAAPYLFNIPWAQVPLPVGVENQLIGRAGDVYVNQTTLEPWRAYFVYHAGPSPVTLTIPATGGTKDAAAAAAEPLALTGCDWVLQIAAAQGERQDLLKTVGALSPGGDGPGDLHQPPSLPHDLSVWLEREQQDGLHQLRRDLRDLGAGAVWDLVVRPAPDGGPVSLTFVGLSDVPGGLDVALATPAGVVDLRRAAGQWQGAVAGETRLRLIVGDPELIAQAAGTLPQPYALLPAYPNPFNPQTTAAFTLPRSARVRLEVYDVAGRRVRTLVDEVRGAGRHTVEWDGADGDGRGLASGMYLLRLRADDFAQTRKLTLVR